MPIHRVAEARLSRIRRVSVFFFRVLIFVSPLLNSTKLTLSEIPHRSDFLYKLEPPGAADVTAKGIGVAVRERIGVVKPCVGGAVVREDDAEPGTCQVASGVRGTRQWIAIQLDSAGIIEGSKLKVRVAVLIAQLQ